MKSAGYELDSYLQWGLFQILFGYKRSMSKLKLATTNFKAPLFIPGECKEQAYTTKELEECKAQIVPKEKII